MQRKISLLITAGSISLFAGAASAQTAMQDTWDINAPNGAPMTAGRPLPSAAAATVAGSPMQDTWDVNAPNGAPARLASPAAAASAHSAAHGYAASAGVADRVIDVLPGTKAVNVRDGETVLFRIGGRSFAWTFEPTLQHTSFRLSEIAPAGVDAQGIQVYCEPTSYERAG